MDRIPILKMGRALLITIQVDMHDQMAIALQKTGLSVVKKAAAQA
jgi:rsbT antagonist protein RsbS